MNTNSNGTIRSAAPAAEKPARQRQPKRTGTNKGAMVATKPADTSTHGGAVNADDESISFWVAKISQSISFVAGWCIKVGQELTAAKEKLGHGNWARLFESGGLRISQRSAEIFMRIGGHPYFGKTKDFSNLPVSYVALSELARLDEKVIEQGVAAGAIDPDMTIHEAKKFVSANQQQPATPAEPLAFNTEKRLERIKRFLKKELEAWPVEQHSFLADYLEAEAKEIRSIPIDDEQPTKGKI